MAAGDENGFWAMCYEDLISCTEELPQCAAYYCAWVNGCWWGQGWWTYDEHEVRVGFDWSASCTNYNDFGDCMTMAENATPGYCYY